MRKKARPYHHGDLKAAMIAAALELVRTKGPRGFTLNEASRTAGVSVSAPYNHFKDKDALLIEITLLGNRTLEADLHSAAETSGTAREKLFAVYLAYIAFAKLHPELFSIMFQSGIDKAAYPEVHAAAARAFNIAAALATQIEPAELHGEHLALAIWSMAHGFASLKADGALSAVGASAAASSAAAIGRRLLLLEKPL